MVVNHMILQSTPILLKTQSTVIDPYKANCIRLLDDNILHNSQTLIMILKNGILPVLGLNSEYTVKYSPRELPQAEGYI